MDFALLKIRWSWWAVEKLKDGLAVLLEELYQLTGRLGKDEEGVFRVDSIEEVVVVTVVEGMEVEEENVWIYHFTPFNLGLNVVIWNH